jgi:hypothetical protein
LGAGGGAKWPAKGRQCWIFQAIYAFATSFRPQPSAASHINHINGAFRSEIVDALKASVIRRRSSGRVGVRLYYPFPAAAEELPQKHARALLAGYFDLRWQLG